MKEFDMCERVWEEMMKKAGFGMTELKVFVDIFN